MLIFLFLLTLQKILFVSGALTFTSDILVDDPFIQGNVFAKMYYDEGQAKIKIEYTVQDSGTTRTLTEVSNYNSKADELGGQTRVTLCSSGCNAFGQRKGIPRYYRESTDITAEVPQRLKGGNYPCGECFTKISPDSSGGVTMICFASEGELCAAEESSGKLTRFRTTNMPTPFTAAFFDVDSTCFSNCKVPLDIGLILDQSGSIDSNEWKDLLNFVRELVNRFDIGPSKIRFTTAIYSCPEGSRGTGFSFLKHGFLDDKAAIQSEIDDIVKKGGCTCIACGLEVMYKEMALNARPLVPKVVLTLTDGYANQPCPSRNSLRSDGVTYSSCSCPSACKSEQYDFLVAAVEQIETLPNLAAEISIAVGSSVSDKELTLLAGNLPENKLKVSNFKELPSIIDKILQASCPISNTNDCGDDCAGLCFCGECVCPNLCGDGDTCTEDKCEKGVALNGCTNTKRSPINDGSENCDKGDKCKVYSCDSKLGCQAVDRVCPSNPLLPCTEPACNSDFGCWFKNTTRCDSSDWCKIGTCDLRNGNCLLVDRPIDDGNPCTIDRCDSTRRIVTHTPVSCSNNNPCVNVTCDMNTGQCVEDTVFCGLCEIAPEIGKNCTHDSIGSSDLCEIPICDPATGNCVSSGRIDCVDPSDACNIGACNSSTGECEFTRKQCEDIPCSITSCNKTTGECEYTPIDCKSNVKSACISEAYCDTIQNECVYIEVNCTTDDLCVDWTCDPLVGCVSDTVNCSDILADDNDACTVPVCSNSTGCYNEEVVCEVNACNETICDSRTGECVPGRVFCVSSDSCTRATCEYNFNLTEYECFPDGGGKRGDLQCDPSKVTAAVAGSVAAGVIIAIVLAAIICCVCCGIGAVAGYRRYFQSGLNNDTANTSPIYKGPKTRESVLYKEPFEEK